MPELFEILFRGEKDKRRTEIHRELKMGVYMHFILLAMLCICIH